MFLRFCNSIGAWSQAHYQLRRGNVDLPAQVIIGQRVPDRAVYYQYAVGVIYLMIGLFVYYRRVSAPRSVHFYVLCLASFVLSCFHYTGKLNNFDQSIYWGNVAASILRPPSFCISAWCFPNAPSGWPAGEARCCTYVPGVFLLAVYVLVAKGMLLVAASSIEVKLVAGARLGCYSWSRAYLLGALVIGA